MNMETQHESESNEKEIIHVQEKLYFLLDRRMIEVCSKCIHNDYILTLLDGWHGYILSYNMLYYIYIYIYVI